MLEKHEKKRLAELDQSSRFDMRTPRVKIFRWKVPGFVKPNRVTITINVLRPLDALRRRYWPTEFYISKR